MPTITRRIDDLVENSKSKKNKGDHDGDSSIDEPDIEHELVQLDEFEALFRVASPTQPVEDDGKQAVKDFKIERKSNDEAEANNPKVKVCGGIPNVPPEGSKEEKANSPATK